MQFGVIIFLFILGAALGSFVNVIALRYNTGLSFLKGSSICLSCKKPLLWYDLVPLFSYLMLKGRCSNCHARFSIQYFIVELISGLAFVFLYVKFGLSLEFLLLSIIYYILSIIFIYDLRHKIIPDSFVATFILLSFGYTIFNFQFSIFNHLIAAIALPLPFFLIWFFSKGRMMGLGDAKFMVGMGLLLGLSKGIQGIFLSFWLGALYILILYLRHKVFNKVFGKRYNNQSNLQWKSELPFAPFLILGTVFSFFLQVNLFSINL